MGSGSQLARVTKHYKDVGFLLGGRSYVYSQAICNKSFGVLDRVLNFATTHSMCSCEGTIGHTTLYQNHTLKNVPHIIKWLRHFVWRKLFQLFEIFHLMYHERRVSNMISLILSYRWIPLHKRARKVGILHFLAGISRVYPCFTDEVQENLFFLKTEQELASKIYGRIIFRLKFLWSWIYDRRLLILNFNTSSWVFYGPFLILI